MKFSILLLLTLGFNACPAPAQEGKDHDESALSAPIKGPLRQSRNPNYVLWIVSEEDPPKSTWWNDHLISFVRACEARMTFQHPIGYAALDSAPDSILYNSDADWVAPAARISPAKSCGTGQRGINS